MFSKFMRLIYPYVELSFFFLLQIALSHRKRDQDIEVEKESNEIEWNVRKTKEYNRERDPRTERTESRKKSLY